MGTQILHKNLLIPVLLPGILIHAAEKEYLIPELQQLEAILWMEGDNAPLRIYPNTPGRWVLLDHENLSISSVFSILCDYCIEINMRFLHIIK